MQLARLHALSATVSLWLLLAFSSWSHAQYPQSLNESSVTVVKSPINPNITVSFKSPPIGTCSTVFATQKQYTGYIHLPPDVLGIGRSNYTTNTFFWFIEARQVPENAPLTIFINGGPGSSSMVGLFQEVGPCEVVEVARGKLGTVAREWGWDRSSNILFIDQPVQVGFSYDTLSNASFNLLNEQTTIPPTTCPLTQPLYTFLNGTFSSGSSRLTANTSQIAAQSMWHFLQSFLATFPEYNPISNARITSGRSKAGIHLFTESYGGMYAPAIASFFRKQNLLRASDLALANRTLEISIASIGIINGWIDLLTQIPFYPRFAYNNSYGIQAISQLQQLNALSSFTGPDGCRAKTLACRGQEAGLDPDGGGTSAYLNELCSTAAALCQSTLVAPYLSSGRSVYDISQKLFDPFPSSLYVEYLNYAEVQQAIGTSINYTQYSQAVGIAFNQTGDYARAGALDDLIEALNDGTRVALIYGDRDYICNWVGGEAISFALAGAAGPAYKGWYTTGYAPIVVNSSYIGGVVREYGNLSFSRVFDAGHLAPAYQPECVFTVAARIVRGTGIGMGMDVDRDVSYSGETNSSRRNTAPEAQNPKCFIRAVNTTCDVDQRNMLASGAGIVINGALYNAESDWKPPPASLAFIAGFPGVAPQSILSNAPATTTQTFSSTSPGGVVESSTRTTRIPTGVYTATEIPVMSSTTAHSSATSIGKRKSKVVLQSDVSMLVLTMFGISSLVSMLLS